MKDVYANQKGASNAGVWQLKNGSVLVTYAAGGGIDCGDVPGCNTEPVKLSIASTWDGEYSPVGPMLPGGVVSPLWPHDQFGRIMPAEDPCWWQDKRGYLHLLTHSNTWAGFSPSLHVPSTLTKHRDRICQNIEITGFYYTILIFPELGLDIYLTE